MYCLSTYVPEKCLLTLQIRLNLLIWTRAIRPVRAQSLQFSKTAKKLNIDLCHFVSEFFTSLARRAQNLDFIDFKVFLFIVVIVISILLKTTF